MLDWHTLVSNPQLIRLALIGFAIVVLGGALLGLIDWLLGPRDKDLSVYIKRPFLFDAKSELELFKLLLELFGDRYYIFPQVGYSHIVTVRKMPYRDMLRYRNSIDRKSADFVLCDKDQVSPQVVIELDGTSHLLPKRVERDEFVDGVMTVTGLPIVHLVPDKLDAAYVKGEVDRVLSTANTAG